MPLRCERHPNAETVAGLCPRCLLDLALETSVEDEARFTPGTILNDRFQITALVGRGGMGEVYRADDLKIGQPVALKFVPLSIVQNGELLHRLYTEVRLGRQVAHPNVCRLFDLSEHDGHPFVVMEFIDGENLESLLKRLGRLTPQKAMDIAREVCAGVAASHDRQVIHGDLKPANIMIDGRGHVRITDFGLSAFAADMTRQTLIAGTPGYMAPEQLQGDLSSASDIYALGLVLSEILTGHRGIPSELQEMIARCRAIDPANRPTAREVLAAFPSIDPLEAAMAAGETPSPEIVAATEPSVRLSPRVASLVLASVIAGLVLVLFTKERVSLEGIVAFPHSPAALSARARKVAGGSAGDSASWFAADPAIHFYYRQSPRALASNDPDGRVTLDEPAPSVPGMVTLSFSADGETRPLTMPSEQPSLSLFLYYILLIPLLAAGAVMALRNIRSGRGDVRGARRIAAWVFICRMLYWLFIAHHTPTFVDEYRLFTMALARSLFYAAEVWIGYLAVEPYIRRRRPQTMIGWKRLLEARFSDPIVARDALIGCGFGIAMLLLEELRHAPPGAPPMSAAVPALSSTAAWTALLFYFQTRAIFYALFALFFLLLLRAFFKQPLIASAFWIVALAALLAAEQHAADYALGITLALALLFVLNRYGLLACAVAFFWYLLLQSTPLTVHADRWYFDRSVAVLILFSALILWSRAAIAKSEL